MKKPPNRLLAEHRARRVEEEGWEVIRSDENGLRRILLPDGSGLVDVWLTTGSWNFVGSPDFRRNDWAGFLNMMALRG